MGSPDGPCPPAGFRRPETSAIFKHAEKPWAHLFDYGMAWPYWWRIGHTRTKGSYSESSNRCPQSGWVRGCDIARLWNRAWPPSLIVLQPPTHTGSLPILPLSPTCRRQANRNTPILSHVLYCSNIIPIDIHYKNLCWGSPYIMTFFLQFICFMCICWCGVPALFLSSPPLSLPVSFLSCFCHPSLLLSMWLKEYAYIRCRLVPV